MKVTRRKSAVLTRGEVETILSDYLRDIKNIDLGDEPKVDWEKISSCHSVEISSVDEKIITLNEGK